MFSSVAAPKPEDGWQAPPGVKGDITLIMIRSCGCDLRKIDGVWKLTRLDVKHSLPVFMVKSTAKRVIELAEQEPAPIRAPVGEDAEQVLRLVHEKSDAEQDELRLQMVGLKP